MNNENCKKKVCENVRVIVYFTLLFVGLLQCHLPFTYKCDTGLYTCPFCGMRHAIDYILNLQFKNAYNSNPLSILLLLFGVFMCIDTIIIIFKRIVKK